MKKKKYLPLYKEWMEDCNAPFLCNYFKPQKKYPEFWEFISPTFEERIEHGSEHNESALAWGVSKDNFTPHDFTALRQTVVLFCAALNGEL